MKICVFGLGYIGLPTAAMLAQSGHRVYGYDVNGARVMELRSGTLSIRERAVRALVQEAVDSDNLTFVDRPVEAGAYVICVPTPLAGDRPDLRCVEDAVEQVAALAAPRSIIVVESTVPPGTTERLVTAALEAVGKSPDDMCIAHCPERVIPGAIVTEMRANDRIVGGRTREDAVVVRALYASFCSGEIALTDCRTAELTKIVENTYRDVNIAFANELAVIAEEAGVDVWETIALANRHPRVNVHRPGPGVGGHCIPMHPYFLSSAFPECTELIQTARRVNERASHRIVRHIVDAVGQDSLGKKIAILGVAYKADADDARNSVSLHIATLLRERGYEIALYDPVVEHCEQPLVGSLADALVGADALLLATDHTAFRDLRPETAAALMRGRGVVDARAMLPEERWRAFGFDVYVLGGKPVPAHGRFAVA